MLEAIWFLSLVGLFSGIAYAWRSLRKPKPREIKFENKTIGEYLEDGIPF